MSENGADEVGLKCIPAVGLRFCLTMSELRQLAFLPLVPVFLTLVSALLIVFDLHDYRSKLPLGSVVLLWSVGMFTLWLYTFGLYAGAILLARRVSKMVVSLPLLGAVAMTINTFTTTLLVASLIGQETAFELFKNNVLTNILVGFLFESIFYLYVVPASKLHVVTGEVEPVKSFIVLPGEKFVMQDIISISSQDHYIEVRTENRSTLVRGRLGDVVAQFPDGYGIMPHRSHWAARSSVDGIAGVGTAKTLRLKDGREMPIARGRASDVQKWFDG